MRLLFLYILKLWRASFRMFDRWKSHIVLRLWGVRFGKNVHLGGGEIIFRQSKAEIELGDDVRLIGAVYENCICSGHKMVLASLEAGAKIVIGKGSGVSCSTIVATKGVFIGEHVDIGAGCMILDSDFHPTDYMERRDSSRVGESKEIHIHSDVWLGAEVMVLKGVTIGQGAVVAARSVVVKDVPSFTIVGGVPAKYLKNIGAD